MADPAKSKKPILIGVLAVLVALLAGGGYFLYRDEATGVCLRTDGTCSYSTPSQCDAEWKSTESFYTAKATCRDLGYTKCEASDRCKR